MKRESMIGKSLDEQYEIDKREHREFYRKLWKGIIISGCIVGVVWGVIHTWF